MLRRTGHVKKMIALVSSDRLHHQPERKHKMAKTVERVDRNEPMSDQAIKAFREALKRARPLPTNPVAVAAAAAAAMAKAKAKAQADALAAADRPKKKPKRKRTGRAAKPKKRSKKSKEGGAKRAAKTPAEA